MAATAAATTADESDDDDDFLEEAGAGCAPWCAAASWTDSWSSGSWCAPWWSSSGAAQQTASPSSAATEPTVEVDRGAGERRARAVLAEGVREGPVEGAKERGLGRAGRAQGRRPRGPRAQRDVEGDERAAGHDARVRRPAVDVRDDAVDVRVPVVGVPAVVEVLVRAALAVALAEVADRAARRVARVEVEVVGAQRRVLGQRLERRAGLDPQLVAGDVVVGRRRDARDLEVRRA
mmetsp:Transcript_23543/g.80934  ORF Transcript_23543/g.80934 Transcript_23543/m.80934 type:complete len:235 (+) Transcript_23543:278-982(+)